MTRIFGAILTGFGLIAIFAYPFLMLRPITKLVRDNPTPKIRARFSMTDLLSLFFLVQLPIALMSPSDIEFEALSALGIGLLVLVSVIVWLAGLRAANHIGIENQMKRIVAIGFTFPAAVMGGFLSCLAMLVLWDVKGNPENWFWVGAFIVSTFLVYKSVKWILRDSTMLAELCASPGDRSSSAFQSENVE